MQEKLERHRVHLDAPVQVLQGPLRVVHEASRTSKARGVDPFSRNTSPFQVARDGLGPSPRERRRAPTSAKVLGAPIVRAHITTIALQATFGIGMPFQANGYGRMPLQHGRELIQQREGGVHDDISIAFEVDWTGEP